MSAAHEPAGSHGASSHHEELADEPETPAWLTLLGIALFFLVVVLFLALPDDDAASAQGGDSAAPAQAEAQPGQPAAVEPAPAH